MPLDLPEHVRREFSTRLMLQLPPSSLTERQKAEVRADMNRVIMGMPGDVFMALDALRLLAEQGNVVAADLFAHECDRLGLTKKFFSYAK
jgi:hypothetical protein